MSIKYHCVFSICNVPLDEQTDLQEGNGSKAKHCVQSLAQQYPVLDSVDARNFIFRIGIIATETFSDDDSDVLRERMSSKDHTRQS